MLVVLLAGIYFMMHSIKTDRVVEIDLIRMDSVSYAGTVGVTSGFELHPGEKIVVRIEDKDVDFGVVSFDKEAGLMELSITESSLEKHIRGKIHTGKIRLLDMLFTWKKN